MRIQLPKLSSLVASLALASFALFLPVSSQAAVTYSTSGGSVASVGDSIGSPYDQIVLDPFSGIFSGPGTYKLNDLHFIVGINANAPSCCYVGAIGQTVTLGADSGTLNVPFSVDINSADTLTIPGGASLILGNYKVVLNGFGPVTAGIGTYDSALFATISAVPEPSTWAMMILGFAGLAWLGWRRSRAAAPTAA